MTPQVEAAIFSIQSLSSTERQQLLHILTQRIFFSTADLKILSAEFWQGTLLQQLSATQFPMPLHYLQGLAVDFLPRRRFY